MGMPSPSPGLLCHHVLLQREEGRLRPQPDREAIGDEACRGPVSCLRPALATEQGSRISTQEIPGLPPQPRMRVLHRPCLSRQLSRQTAAGGKPASLATRAARPGAPSSPGQLPGGWTGPDRSRSHCASPGSRTAGPCSSRAGGRRAARPASSTPQAPHLWGTTCKPNSPRSQTQPLAKRMLPLNQPHPCSLWG